jgi:hypothetical protein
MVLVFMKHVVALVKKAFGAETEECLNSSYFSTSVSVFIITGDSDVGFVIMAVSSVQNIQTNMH